MDQNTELMWRLKRSPYEVVQKEIVTTHDQIAAKHKKYKKYQYEFGKAYDRILKKHFWFKDDFVQEFNNEQS